MFHAELSDFLANALGAADYTITGDSATITGTLDCHTLREIIAAAVVVGYDALLSAGVFTLQPAQS